MSILPTSSHGDTLPVVKSKEKSKGSKEARRVIGAEYTAMLPFDGCAHVPIVIEGADVKVPQSILTERNLKMDFAMAKFHNLVIEFFGGDFGAIRYTATATGVEFLNLTAPAGGPGREAGK